MAKAKPKRLYQAWKGNNRFFCGGRLIFGPDVASMFLSTLLVAGPAVAFCIKVYLKIVHKHTNHPENWSIVLFVACLLSLLDIIFLFLTSSRDPGIVPRSLRPPESDEVFEVTTPSMEWVNGRTPHLKLPRTKDVIVNGHAVRVKYCDSCLLYRPPRASHCSICNNCVQKFDHHCPWVGQCIGLRNYRFFFMFVSTSTILCLYVFTFSWINILSARKNKLKAVSHDIVSIVLIVYCFIVVWFVGGLTVFHSYLICTNQTTCENFRFRYDKKENPYNRGVIRNITETFLTEIPRSMNDFRQLIEEEEHCVLEPEPALEDVMVSSKEKVDIELGAKLAEERNYSLPKILHDLDYDDESDDDLKPTDEGGLSFDTLFPDEQNMQETLQISIDGDVIRGTAEGYDPENEVAYSVLVSNAVHEARESEKRHIGEDEEMESIEIFGGADGVRDSMVSSESNRTKNSYIRGDTTLLKGTSDD